MNIEMDIEALTDQDKVLIEHACTRLVLESVAANDRQDYEAFADFFTSDGLLHRPAGDPLCGREEIIDSYRVRPASRITRHICTNILIRVESAVSARGTTYVTLYAADGAQAGGSFGVKCDPRTLIGELEDRFELTASGWKIAERRARFVMHT